MNNLSEEIWKDIEGYDGLYQVSSWGRVKNSRTDMVLKGVKDKDGYLRIGLYKNGKRIYRVHRLVAQAFIPNPENKSQVNHIDENKENNYVENLEWVTAKENLNYGTRNLRASKLLSKPIICIEKGVEYSSGKECARQMGLHPQHITAVLKGTRNHTGGYTFKYKGE